MPALNEAAFIGGAIESVLAQTFGDFELIVIDNGSSDGTVEIASKYATNDPRVTVYQEPRQGISIALNAGLAKCTGTYYARLDADDVFHPQKLAIQVAKLQTSEPIVTYTEGWIMGPKGEVAGELYNRDRVTLPKGRGEGNIFGPDLFRRNFILGASVMASRSVLGTRPFDEGAISGEDWDLWVRLARHYRFEYIPVPTYGYRIHEGNTWNKRNWRARCRALIYLYQKWLVEYKDLDDESTRILLRQAIRRHRELGNLSGAIVLALRHRQSLNLLSESLRRRIRL